MDPLTKKQQMVLAYIEECLAEQDPPTQREIADHFDMHQNSVYQLLGYLRKKGYLADNSLHRGVRLSEDYYNYLWEQQGIPIVGRVAAGQPILAEENLEGRFNVDEVFDAEDGSFMLRVTGDSMVDDGIMDGDLVLVEPDTRVHDGRIAVVMVDGEATIKRVVRQKNRIALKPANKKAGYKPIYISPKQVTARIVGQVVACIRTQIK